MSKSLVCHFAARLLDTHQSMADASCAQGCRMPISNSFLSLKNNPELSSEREKGGWGGPHRYAKHHGSSDDPPDILIPVVSPAPKIVPGS